MGVHADKAVDAGAAAARLFALLVGGALLLCGCETTNDNRRAVTGAVLGGIAGAVVGSQVDEDHRTEGAVIGGVAGAVVGGTIGHMLDRAARRAAEENRQVVTPGAEEGERVVATPIGREGNYRLVEVTYYDAQGKVVRKEVKRVPLG